ncbi:reverse transcriptase domain-containing protein, partial [Vibrio cholerae]|uniref:reverse transcriptase domain-containing protein n=1 Tax=Vibrio cholerae TaxID=666 RepID=UPI003B210899
MDMEKAFDCVPREMIWWALRSKGIPEIYIDIIRDMYRNSDSMVRTADGDTKTFPVTVGVHQGSVLSPFLFCAILDELSNSNRHEHEHPPWLLM